MRKLTTSIFLLFFSFSAFFGQRLKLESMEMGADLVMLSPANKSSWGFVLEIRSRELFDCGNYQIVTETKTGNKSVFIRIVGAQKPETCEGALAPAKTRVTLDLPEGEYDFKIGYQTFPSFNAKLTINSEGRVLEPAGENELFRLNNPKLMRIPDGLVWGKMEFREIELKAEAESFFDELKKIGAIPAFLETGDYGDFYVREKGMQSLRKLSNGAYEWPFIFQYAGDKELLKRTAEELSQKSGNQIRFSISSAEGSLINPWVLH